MRSWGGIALLADAFRENMDFGKPINRVLSIAHIVLFCRRPRFSFDPEHFTVNGNTISCQLVCRINGEKKSIPFSFPCPLKEGETRIVLSPNPYQEIHIVNEKGEGVRKLTAHGLSQHPAILKQENWVNDLEVLYVGNVYQEGDASAFDRVYRDEGLQKLLAGMRKALPDDDIIIYAFEYLPYELIPLFGALKPKTQEKKEARFISIKDNPLTEFQKICMAQAALIAYFGPPWNVSEKRISHPASLSVLKSCESLDFSGVVIEISTVRSHFRLYSGSAPSMQHHMHMMDMSVPDQRAHFFNAVL